LLDGGDIAHLEPAGGRVDGVEALRRPGVGVVVRHDVEQQEGVAAVVGREDNPAPEVADADGPHPGVARLVDRLKVKPLVRVQLGDSQLLELLHGLANTGLDRLFESVEAFPERVREGELRHGTGSFAPVEQERRS
jgi:hypothetical protein